MKAMWRSEKQLHDIMYKGSDSGNNKSSKTTIENDAAYSLLKLQEQAPRISVLELCKLLKKNENSKIHFRPNEVYVRMENVNELIVLIIEKNGSVISFKHPFSEWNDTTALLTAIVRLQWHVCEYLKISFN